MHDQTKVESSSKYPLRVTGLILFNSFINRGIVDNIDLPEAALSNQNNTTGNGSAGATLRQTILGLQGYGPRIAGARTSANVDLDFFAGLAYSSYATSAGTVRMRTASVNLGLDERFDSGRLGRAADLSIVTYILRNGCRTGVGGCGEPMDVGAPAKIRTSDSAPVRTTAAV